jgi:hypothetical protein
MADGVSQDALTALEAAINALLPAPVPAGLTRRMRVRPQAVRALGLGGYVGRHLGPDGTLQGRRVAARVDLDVEGGNDATAGNYAATLAGQLLTGTRSEYASRGIRRIQGIAPAGNRNIAFDVDFEFVHTPTAGEGLITTLALDTYTNVTPYRSTLVADFAAASLVGTPVPLADFIARTDAQAAPAGAWSVSPVDPAAIVQTAASAGGVTSLAEPRKAGAMLLWRPGGVALNLPRFVLSVAFSSIDPDGVGVVFHRRAADDYRYFLASARHGYHLFGRRRPAGFEVTATAPFGFSTTVPQRLAVTVFDGRLIAEFGERRTLVADIGTDSATAGPAGGEVGLLTHANSLVRFTAGRLMALT